MLDSSRSTYRVKEQPFSAYLNEKSTQLCSQCGLQFESIPQLLNHRRRFCQNSGYDNLTGLLMKETGRNDLKIDYKMKSDKKNAKRDNQNKMKNYGQYSLSKIKPVNDDIIDKKSMQLYQDMMGLEKHKNQINSVRAYQYGSRMFGSATKNNQMQTNETDFRNKVNPLSSSKSVSSFNYQLDQEGFGKTYKNNTDELQKLLLKNQQSISPATNTYGGQNYRQSDVKKSFADQKIVHYAQNPASQQFKLHQLSQYPSILHKSDASIANMSKQQKITYAQYKLDQLRQIKLLYFENGGQSKQFKKNIENMIVFYQKLLKDCKTNQLSDSGLSEASRPDTPIMKLQENEQIQAQKKKTIIKKDQQQNIQQNQTKNLYGQNIPFGFPQFQMPMPMMDPNYIMAQNYAQMYYTKMMEEMLKQKSQQNRKLIEALIQGKNKKKTSKQTQNEQLDQKNSQAEEKYRFSNQVDVSTPSQERILKLLQQEQLDEIKLISKLPINLQDEKLQSIIKNSELRFNMQKQVLRQKLERLSWQGKLQSFEEQRNIKNNDWVGKNNKEVIKNQMNHYLNGFREQFKPMEYQ